MTEKKYHNPPKGFKHHLSIKDVKYCLIKQRVVKKGAKGLESMGEEQKVEYYKIRAFIANLTVNVGIRKDKKRIFFILKKTQSFIKSECPIYSKRFLSGEEMKTRIAELFNKFK